jgi:hypothetical protein
MYSHSPFLVRVPVSDSAEGNSSFQHLIRRPQGLITVVRRAVHAAVRIPDHFWKQITDLGERGFISQLRGCVLDTASLTKHRDSRKSITPQNEAFMMVAIDGIKMAVQG